jgi:quercetin dioxygenase-like cupin family protein
MSNRSPWWWALLAVALLLSAAGPTPGQEAAVPATGSNMAEMKFSTFPGMPTCSTGSVQSGDPTKGPSIILAKMAAGCSFPWHWHTPNEHLMMVTGVGRVEMKDGKPLTLRAGGFAMMPSQHVHRFTCGGPCALYVYSDAPFDMHYVDGQGKELSPDEALKVVKETAAKATK